MRGTAVSLAFLAGLEPAAIAEAQAPGSFPPSLVVVSSGQMSRIGFTTSLDVDCRFIGYVPIDVVGVPANGRVFLKHVSDFPTYGSNSNRAPCNGLRRPGVEILYESRRGFAGTDAFVIRLLDQNHVPTLKRYTVEVQ